MSEMFARSEGVILDLDGTVYEGSRLIPGARGAVARLRSAGLAVRFVTNTTRRPRSAVLERLRELGVECRREELLTAPLAAVHWLRERGFQRVALCLRPATREDFADFTVDEEAPQAVVVGDLEGTWSFEVLDRAFRQLMSGAELVALQKNRYWKSASGLSLDAGPFVAALEYASGKEAVVVGKPSRPFFEAAARSMGLALGATVVVGDDLESDVQGARTAGARSVLVRTGKFRQEDLNHPRVRPDLVLGSLAELPAALGLGDVVPGAGNKAP